MAATRLLPCVVFLTMLLCVTSAAHNTVTDTSTDRKNDKVKVDDMVNDMYSAFMVTKNMMSMMLMFVSPIIQIKGFGLSVMNTLINIGRFLLQLQSTRRIQEMADMHRVAMIPGVYQADHRHSDPVGMDHNKMHDQPVYIIKDHDHGSWGSDDNDKDHDQALTHGDDVIWAKDPDNHWQSDEPFFYTPSHYQKGSSSQKLGYYAHPPVTSFSSRLGVPAPPPPATPQDSLPPAHASYVSEDMVGQVYPFFSPNLTTTR